MSEIFSPGTRVKIGAQYTQEIATMGKVYEVVEHLSKDHWDMYAVRDGNGVAREFMGHLLEETDEPLNVGATLFELLAAPYGTKGFSPHHDTVLHREKHGWVLAKGTGHHPLSQDELDSWLPVYLVGSFL